MKKSPLRPQRGNFRDQILSKVPPLGAEGASSTSKIWLAFYVNLAFLLSIDERFLFELTRLGR